MRELDPATVSALIVNLAVTTYGSKFLNNAFEFMSSTTSKKVSRSSDVLNSNKMRPLDIPPLAPCSMTIVELSRS